MPIARADSAASTTMNSGTQLRRVRSQDGTTLVLERVTQGSSDLVLIGGGPTRRGRWARAAVLLEGAFSCWLMDRRGKGDSGDTLPYSFEREYDDLAAVVASFPGPVSLAGHSSGGTVALGAVLRGVPVGSLVLYEPPWPLDGPLAGAAVIDRVEALVDGGDRDAALELAFREMVGMPAAAVAGLRRSPMWAEWTALVHTWPREMREASQLSPDLTCLAGLDLPTLLIVGAETSPHLRQSTQAVAAAVPGAALVELPGQGHGALDLAPRLVAEAILAFPGHPRTRAAKFPSPTARESLDGGGRHP
jgi:pimeloyl-ACP methyl ester carboxylesterase